VSEPLLEAVDISVHRQGRLTIDKVSVLLREGDCIGIAGPNGAGKSSLLAALSGWFPLSSGSVRIKGRPIPAGRVPVDVGFAVQEPVFYPRLTGRENLRLFGSLYGLEGAALDKRIQELIDVMELGAWADQGSGGYSGGVARRLHLAIALINEPAVLLLDEPTVGLDPGTRHSLLNTIRRLRDTGTGVILTSQILGDLEVTATRMLVIVDGRAAIDEETSNLMGRVGSGVIVAEIAEQDAKVDLAGLNGVLSWRVEHGLLRVRVLDPHRAMRDVMDRLDRDGALVASMSLEPPSLQDLLQELVPAL
jgi:ABC-2 type transport system ATP-binding protein